MYNRGNLVYHHWRFINVQSPLRSPRKVQISNYSLFYANMYLILKQRQCYSMIKNIFLCFISRHFSRFSHAFFAPFFLVIMFFPRFVSRHVFKLSLVINTGTTAVAWPNRTWCRPLCGSWYWRPRRPWQFAWRTTSGSARSAPTSPWPQCPRWGLK